MNAISDKELLYLMRLAKYVARKPTDGGSMGKGTLAFMLWQKRELIARALTELRSIRSRKPSEVAEV